MTPRVGRLFVLGFEGHSIPPEVAYFASHFGLGGVILFARNCPDSATVARLAAEARALDTADGWTPLVLVDQEGGRVERIKDSVDHLPPARELAGMDEEEVEALARSQAAQLAALGVTVNLAPVCDVARPGANDVIGDRSFGPDAATVARYCGAYLRGLRSSGVAGCLKHFPGHGASIFDTHEQRGTVELGEEELRRVDLDPFARLVGEGAPLVMACHLAYPAVDPLPACLSTRWLTDILRDELGFSGGVISDDMEMAAVAEVGDEAETALRAIDAGCDMLIYGHMLGRDADVFSIAERLERELSPARIKLAAQRLEGVAQA